QEARGAGQADALAGTGDNDDLAFEVHVHDCSAFRREAFFERTHYRGPRLLEVRLVLGPVVPGTVTEVAQRDFGAVAGQRLEVQIHQRAQLADHRNVRWRIPFEHELLHRLDAV